MDHDRARHRGGHARMINVVGGYFVTDRMLGMFKKKDVPAKKERAAQ